MNKEKPKKSTVLFIMVALLVAVGIGFFISPYASEHPDGLEWVAESGVPEEMVFIDEGEVAVWESSPMPDYTIFGDSKFSGMMAGLVGTLLMFVLGWGVGILLKKSG